MPVSSKHPRRQINENRREGNSIRIVVHVVVHVDLNHFTDQTPTRNQRRDSVPNFDVVQISNQGFVDESFGE